MSRSRRWVLAVLLAAAPPAFAIDTAFTYQGTLEDGGSPADGAYDLQFQLLDGSDAPIGAPLTLDDVAVVDGVFTVALDFGAAPFDGSPRRLRIGVRPGAGGAFVALVPPTDLRAIPYAQVAAVAEVAATVGPNAVGSASIVNGSITAADVNTAQVQARVAGMCPAGSSIRSIDPAGAVTCQAGGTGSFALPYAATLTDAGPLFAVTNDGTGPAISGTHDGAASTGAGVFGSAEAAGTGVAGTSVDGSAARFYTTHADSTANTLEVTSNSHGSIPDNTLGNVASFTNTNTNSVAAAVRGEVTTIFGNFGAAGIFGVSKGTGGFAGLFHASNPSGNGPAVVAINDGNGNAITANASQAGNAVEASIDGEGNAIYGWVPSFADGRAARFAQFNEDNRSDAVTVTTVGNGIAVNAKVDRTTGTSPALRGEVNSIFANFGTAGVYGISSGTGGVAGLFHASNASGNGPALIAIADGQGNGITANASNAGDGIEATADGTGSAIFAWTPNFGTGRAARFANYNTANSNAVLTAEQHSSGAIALFRSGNPAAVNVARINAAGRGFFNGGTQVGGADVAEVVPTSGTLPVAGDVVEIDPEAPSHFRLAATPRSTRVAGVISTRPGVLLNHPAADEADDIGAPALALSGRVPVKVTDENGAVGPGDLLVASSTPGHAMRASPDPGAGTVIGKALEAFDDTSIGLDAGVIEMLVMLR